MLVANLPRASFVLAIAFLISSTTAALTQVAGRRQQEADGNNCSFGGKPEQERNFGIFTSKPVTIVALPVKYVVSVQVVTNGRLNRPL